MNGWFSFYNEHTGMFVNKFYRGDPAFAIDNAGAGLIPMAGRFDPQSQRVDIATGEVIDYKPPQPSPDYEWIHDDANGNRVRRWQLTAAAQAIFQEDAQARAEIDALERKLTRALLEDRLGITPTKEEKDAGAMTLDEIQTALVDKRTKLKR